ncbi:hypothetical protein HELRODRAFT_166565 [Helobdella robusta]|uniref:RING-type domain-containing protein n=1 Tax=Helobdella robusta TaxID=6412 RepID=T1EY93_HELRO|nr:hypothetical protein HELRODRAFT_166565 [Helobdella robusta]ESO11560.1 hypothetical protein HELRODRAFT_166565 [Helobdella robusta]
MQHSQQEIEEFAEETLKVYMWNFTSEESLSQIVMYDNAMKENKKMESIFSFYQMDEMELFLASEEAISTMIFGLIKVSPCDIFYLELSENRRYKLPFIKGMFIDNCCGICLEDFQNKSFVSGLKCLHSFHFDCIKEWLERKSSCSTCRNEISTNLAIERSIEVTEKNGSTCLKLSIVTSPKVNDLIFDD